MLRGSWSLAASVGPGWLRKLREHVHCDSGEPPVHRLRARLRRSPVDGWAPYVATARVLTRERLVNRELLDVRGSLDLRAGGGHRGLNPRRERVEVLA
jgi:hypothetical protein